MKQEIQKLAHKLGYHISKIGRPSPQAGPFVEMTRLCADIAEPTIFDVGAHHGQTAKEFRKYFPTSRIYSFEPFPESFEILMHNTSVDRGIRVFNYGLTDKAGVFPFHSNLSSATNSLLPADEMGSKTWGEGILETQGIVHAHFNTVDAVIAEQDIQSIDILKMDVQGVEHRVLKGALGACRNSLIGVVYSEIIIQPTYTSQKRLDEMLKVFHDAGFELHNVYNLSNSTDGKLRQFDAIFTSDRSANDAGPHSSQRA
jgi:FkbM family methyltransferase